MHGQTLNTVRFSRVWNGGRIHRSAGRYPFRLLSGSFKDSCAEENRHRKQQSNECKTCLHEPSKTKQILNELNNNRLSCYFSTLFVIKIMMRTKALLLVIAGCGVAYAQALNTAPELNNPVIQYETAPLDNPVTDLNLRLAEGSVRLKFDSTFGY